MVPISKGRFTLAAGVLSLSALKFQIPGAAVQLDGTYGLRSEALEFDGTLRMQATISQAAGGGAKSVFLKIVDPLFKKEGRRHRASDQSTRHPRPPEVRPRTS